MSTQFAHNFGFGGGQEKCHGWFHKLSWDSNVLTEFHSHYWIWQISLKIQDAMERRLVELFNKSTGVPKFKIIIRVWDLSSSWGSLKS